MSAGRSFVAGPLTALGIRLGHRLLLALGATWRVRFVGNRHVDRARFGRGAVLYALPHGGLLPLAYLYRDRDAYLLISRSRDGEIITSVTTRLGFRAVRGSSSRGGGQGAVEMAARAREGYDLGVTPDGPRGPRGSVAPGTLHIAARGDVLIVPVAIAARPAWRASSWDRFLVPAPFARVWVVFGPAIAPETAGDDDEGTARVARAMADADEEAQSYAAGRAVPAGALRVPA